MTLTPFLPRAVVKEYCYLLLALAFVLLLVGLLAFKEPPEGLADWAHLAQVATLLVGLVGGFWALHRFGHERRTRVGDVLIRLHQDFRNLFEDLVKIEQDGQYKTIETQLEAILKQRLGVCEVAAPVELDKVLNHFLLVYSLDANHQIERQTVLVSYRYYGLMLTSDKRLLLRLYIHRYFPTLAEFLEDRDIFSDDERYFPRRKIGTDKVQDFIKRLNEGKIDDKSFSAKLAELQSELIR